MLERPATLLHGRYLARLYERTLASLGFMHCVQMAVRCSIQACLKVIEGVFIHPSLVAWTRKVLVILQTWGAISRSGNLLQDAMTGLCDAHRVSVVIRRQFTVSFEEASLSADATQVHAYSPTCVECPFGRRRTKGAVLSLWGFLAHVKQPLFLLGCTDSDLI